MAARCWSHSAPAGKGSEVLARLTHVCACSMVVVRGNAPEYHSTSPAGSELRAAASSSLVCARALVSFCTPFDSMPSPVRARRARGTLRCHLPSRRVCTVHRRRSSHSRGSQSAPTAAPGRNGVGAVGRTLALAWMACCTQHRSTGWRALTSISPGGASSGASCGCARGMYRAFYVSAALCRMSDTCAGK